MEISKLSAYAHNGEVADVATQFAAVFKTKDWSAQAKLTRVFTNLETENQKFIELIMRMKAASTNKQNDDERDACVLDLLAFIQGMVRYPVDEVKRAAQKISEILKHYSKDIMHGGYAQESTMINSLLMDLATPEAVANIALIPECATLIANLQAAQDKFTAELVSYEEKRSEELLKNASKMKPVVLNLINKKVISYVNGEIAADETQYIPLANTLNEIIESINTQVKKRRNKGTSPDDTSSNGSGI